VQFNFDDTIAALASAAGSAARGILRLSGSEVQTAINEIFTPDDSSRWNTATRAQRHLGVLQLRDFRTPLQVAVYLWPNARSYTGQPSAELHLPGSPPLLEAALGELYAHGARPAHPGEFTMRAFLAGRIDLVQAEAVLGVIDADDQPQFKTALSQLAGGVSGRIDAVRSDLLNLLADLEAGLDFVEDDIEFVSRKELLTRIESARDAMALLLSQASSRMISTGRRRVVIAGLPNAGKSTLFNTLIGRSAALVSGERGTTRDYLSADCDWNGTAINLIDTAGWEKANDELTAEAQQRRRAQLEQADLVLWCTPANLEAEEQADDRRSRLEISTARCPILEVRTKSDLIETHSATNTIDVSAAQGTGIEKLIVRATAELSRDRAEGQELVGTTAARCRESLENTIGTLERAHAAAANGEGEEIIAIDLHDSLGHLGRILGTVYTDDILDRIFSRFCIGK
jgi:tRNA modification GTPase